MSESSAASENPALQAVRALAVSFHYEEGHSTQVTHLSLKLFDELAALHGLGEDDRFRLHCAAILHDIGVPSGDKGHHKIALNLIMETPAWPLAESERGIIASIARYHRKAPPKPDHEHFSALDAADQKRVRVLAALLRVGDALDRCHSNHVQDLSCELGEQCIIVHCTGTPCGEESGAALKKGDLFENVFQRNLDIAWNGNMKEERG